MQCGASALCSLSLCAVHGGGVCRQTAWGFGELVAANVAYRSFLCRKSSSGAREGHAEPSSHAVLPGYTPCPS